jgi:hypothetical protein
MNSREAQISVLGSEKARLEVFQARAMLNPATTMKRTDIDDEILVLGEEIKKLNGNPGIFLAPASHWSIKNGQVVHSDETAIAYPLRDAFNQQIGNVRRQGNGKWIFELFGKSDIPASFYNTKEEALAGARCWA